MHLKTIYCRIDMLIKDESGGGNNLKRADVENADWARKRSQEEHEDYIGNQRGGEQRIHWMQNTSTSSSLNLRQY